VGVPQTMEKWHHDNERGFWSDQHGKLIAELEGSCSPEERTALTFRIVQIEGILFAATGKKALSFD
jgi:hypothetical protein